MQCSIGSLPFAGGSETFSDLPIRYSRPVRKRLLQANKAMKKGPMGVVKLLRGSVKTSLNPTYVAKGLKMKDLAPEPPAIKNFSTGMIYYVSHISLSGSRGGHGIKQRSPGV